MPLRALLSFLLLLAAMAHPLLAQEDLAPETPQKAILVTGASSGIGLRTTEVLAANGFHVYAGARKKEGRGLFGLINNAGVVILAPLIEVSEEDLAFQMDVNVFGPYRVTKAFAPLLIESGGRVSTTGSISGFVTWGFGGPYTMSKHAVEAFTDVLAQELQGFGVGVSIVEPGNFKSRITTNMRERLQKQGYSTEGSRYQAALDDLLSRPMGREQFQQPDAVAEAFLHAMRDPEPKLRYMVVPNRNEAAMTVQSAMRRVVQLNEGQEYAYSREEMLRMLEEMLPPETDPAD